MNLATAPNVVFHYLLYFSSPFANFSNGLEIRLSLSPATLFPGAPLPNHTKMFEHVHLVTSMEDFAGSQSLGLSDGMASPNAQKFSLFLLLRNSGKY